MKTPSTLSAPNASTAITAVNAAQGEFTAMEPGGGSLIVDDFLFDALDNMCAVDSTFTAVQGVLTYSFGDFKLAPRSAAS